MEQLNNLRSASDVVLNGLKADDSLKARILSAASEKTASQTSTVKKSKSSVSSNIRWMKFVPAVCCVAAALAVALFVGLNFRDIKQGPVINSFSAGVRKTSPLSLRASDKDDASSMLNMINISSGGILYPKDNGYFPMVRLGGKVYRQINLPVPERLILTNLGTVSFFSDDPALEDESIDLSNLLPVETPVYGIDGCGSAFAIAELSGEKIIFQRSAFLGDAILPEEKLSDTLPEVSQIVSISDNTGMSVSDSSCAKELFTLLLDNAEYKGSEDITGERFILIRLDNGLAYQLRLNGSLLSSCGTWSCPEFVEAFEKVSE